MPTQVSRDTELREKIVKAIGKLRSGNQSFEQAYNSYVEQYGYNVIQVNEPLNIAGTVDPVIIIFGRNTAVRYSDSKKILAGSLGALELKVGTQYIIGRREPQDSRLVVWDSNGREQDLELYNPEAGTIPSRIHGALLFLDDSHVLFSDLSSSSGTVLVGESSREGNFVRVYDPGSESFPRIHLKKINMERKD